MTLPLELTVRMACGCRNTTQTASGKGTEA